jgi:hypothetical protein
MASNSGNRHNQNFATREARAPVRRFVCPKEWPLAIEPGLHTGIGVLNVVIPRPESAGLQLNRL